MNTYDKSVYIPIKAVFKSLKEYLYCFIVFLFCLSTIISSFLQTHAYIMAKNTTFVTKERKQRKMGSKPPAPLLFFFFSFFLSFSPYKTNNTFVSIFP